MASFLLSHEFVPFILKNINKQCCFLYILVWSEDRFSQFNKIMYVLSFIKQSLMYNLKLYVLLNQHQYILLLYFNNAISWCLFNWCGFGVCMIMPSYILTIAAISFFFYKYKYSTNCRVLQPFVMGLLIQYFEHDSQTTKSQAYTYACSLILLTFLHSILKHHIDLGTLEIGMRLRIACSSLIYRKVTLKAVYILLIEL